MKAKLENILLVLILVVITSIVIFNFDISSTKSIRENKMLAVFPDVNPFHDKFPKKMDEYINDRIGFKFDAIQLINKLFPVSLRADLKGKVFAGKENWLFYNDIGETVQEFQRTDRYSNEELENIKNEFVIVNEFAKQNNIKLYIMVPPMKHNVYPEFYVKSINQLPLPSKYETVRNYLKDVDIDIIDLIEPLKKRKTENTLYYLSDEHWNYYGARIAYRELTNELKKSFPNIYILNDNDFVLKNDNFLERDGTLETLFGGLDFNYLDWNLHLEPIDNITVRNIKIETKNDGSINMNYETDNLSAPKAYIVHDSFLGLMIYLNKSFSHTIAKWEWGVSPLKYQEDILKEKPDILIWQLQERYLDKLAKR